MKKNPEISVIIPIYNGEKYLKECLDSVINQTFKDIEIICVNDGSTDDTSKILNFYSKKDNRIIIINQPNSGAGAARNNALKIATGKYLSILDADDIFETNMLEIAYHKAEKFKADITVYSCDVFSKNSTTFCDWGINRKLLPSFEPFCISDVKKDVFRLFVGWTWDKLIKRDFICKYNLKFQEQRTTNDALFMFDAIVLAKSIVTIDSVLAHHRDHETSISNTREKSWWCFYDMLIALKSDLIRFKMYDKLKIDYLNYAMNFALWHLDTLAEPSHSLLLNKLKDEWIANLGIPELTLEDSFNSYEYYRFQKISNKNQIPVTIIIPTYNSKDYIPDLLNSLQKEMSEDFEVFLIDGNSSDQTISLIENYNFLKIIHCPYPNYLHQIKMGLECANGNYLFIANPNMIISLSNIKKAYDYCSNNAVDCYYSNFKLCINNHPFNINISPGNNITSDFIYKKEDFDNHFPYFNNLYLLLCKCSLFYNPQIQINENLLPEKAYDFLIYSTCLNANKISFTDSAPITINFYEQTYFDEFYHYNLMRAKVECYGKLLSENHSIISKQKEFLSNESKKNDALQNLNNELEKKNQSLKTELDILKLSTLKLTKENQSLKKELDSFNHSISYKIGRIITYLPRLLLHRG